MHKPEPQKEHEWLHRLVGEWTSEMSGCEPIQPAQTYHGKETVRSIGGLWVVCEGEMPGDDTHRSIMTLGYDPAKKKFVGTFIASMMTFLWTYEGELDPGGKALVLNAEGPTFTGDGKMAKYRDTITFISDDERTLTSHILGDDGKWTHFMEATYRRLK